MYPRTATNRAMNSEVYKMTWKMLESNARDISFTIVRGRGFSFEFAVI